MDDYPIPEGRKVLVELHIAVQDWEDEQDIMDRAVTGARAKGLEVYDSDINDVYAIGG